MGLFITESECGRFGLVNLALNKNRNVPPKLNLESHPLNIKTDFYWDKGIPI